MRFEILTLFPEIFEGFLKASLIGKACSRHLITIHRHCIRDWAKTKHRQADDRPYGGGAGMVLMAEPVHQALKAIKRRCRPQYARKKIKYIVLSPRGQRLTMPLAAQLAQYKQLVLLCGHYGGIDDRILNFFDDEISIGDYVIMGGEVAAMVVIEAVARYLPGVVKQEQSVLEDSFSMTHGKGCLLEWPQYTRPKIWRGKKVPSILLSGNHQKIKQWRVAEAFKITKTRRPDLLSGAVL